MTKWEYPEKVRLHFFPSNPQGWCDSQRILYIKNIIIFFWIMGLALSFTLWTSPREFPLSPLFSFLPKILHPWDKLWLILNLTLLLTSLYLKRPIKTLFLLLFSFALWTVMDQTRLQPWVYQYWSMTLVILFHHSFSLKGKFKKFSSQYFLNIIRIIMICIYMWSGIHKINHSYINSTFSWFVKPIHDLFPGSVSLPISMQTLALSSAIIEALLGIGLIFAKSRPFSVKTIMALHVFILLCIGPLGHNWNSVVWPWNFAMMSFTIVLFYKTPQISFKNIFVSRGIPHYCSIIFFVFLPFLSNFGLWDTYLSFSLYSGNSPRAYFIVREKTKAKLPPSAQNSIFPYGDKYLVDPFSWSFEQLNVPLPAELRNFRNYKNYICSLVYQDTVVLYIETKPNIKTGKRNTIFESCEEEKATRNISSVNQ